MISLGALLPKSSRNEDICCPSSEPALEEKVSENESKEVTSNETLNGQKIDRKTFVRFRALVYAHAGIWLRDGKEALVCARVGKRMRALGLSDYREYLEKVEQDVSGDERVILVNCIATHVTSFFREKSHFDELQHFVRRWLSEGQDRFRFWSAACSTGEEPYSMAMVLQEVLESPSLDWKILGTDISTRVLDICREGVYPEDRVGSVPEDQKGKWFTVHADRRGSLFEIRASLKDRILFKRLNLAAPPFPMKGPMDVVFCRNVMIYFDHEVRKALLEEIHRLIKPGGYLMVGHAESLTGMGTAFKMVRPSLYIKP